MMDISKAKPTGVKIDNLKLAEFFDSEFVGLLEQEIGNVDFQHFCLHILDEKGEKSIEKMAFAHETPEDKINNITEITSSTPEILNKLLKVADQFIKKKQMK